MSPLNEILLLLLAVACLAFVVLKIKKMLNYRTLRRVQEAIVQEYENRLEFSPYQRGELPSFENRLATLPDCLLEQTFLKLHESALRNHRTERSYFPGHKKGGTISYEALHETAPEIIAFYQSRYMRMLVSEIVGERVVPTPLHDQSSCSLLFYDKPRDHIGWHYDYNFYQGRHFTVLLPLVNRHNSEPRLSSARLVVLQNDQEVMIPTPPNSLVIFEGARVYHKVTRLDRDETRIILSMTYCTQPQASFIMSWMRRFKDIAYYGIRALWT